MLIMMRFWWVELYNQYCSLGKMPIVVWVLNVTVVIHYTGAGQSMLTYTNSTLPLRPVCWTKVESRITLVNLFILLVVLFWFVDYILKRVQKGKYKTVKINENYCRYE